ncbi:YhfC family intramembrane metalloprotease [Priestia taiwanensis]|uniref:Membrane protein YhfC n=1 Tax=Priestia taiwanensis TaxID=1347902 RepID=A0A917ENQ7_9BACI|nr:YhfC family intramembrane metalloprotease [Priestia taiwanensis]MBM7363134.1 putative membrane protein YhfC [Priestia taiwanensis]GGE67976.1 putative membrane protein YhfC [Priestia taiwanensis]
MVNETTMTWMLVVAVFSFLVPIVVLIFLKKKYDASLKVFFIGMLTFFLFASVLEGFVHKVVLVDNEVTKELFSNPWLYMVYGGLMAGIFEEIGRYMMFKYTLRGRETWKDGVTFGAGHGGIEMILITGLGSITSYVYATMINNNTFDSLMTTSEMIGPLQTVKQQLLETEWHMSGVAIVERTMALFLQIGLSILVLYAVRSKKFKYVLYAIGVHAIINFPAALYQKGVISNIWMLEGIVTLVGIASIIWIIKSKALFRGENNKISI